MKTLSPTTLTSMYNEALAIAKEKQPERFAKANMHEWKFCLNTRKASLGLCNYNKKQVQLSKWHILEVDKERVMNTILHEVAHAICPKEGHNDTWKRVFKSMGGSGDRVASRQEVLKSNTALTTWKVVNTLTGDVVAQYFNKPRRDFSRCIVGGDMSTLGKLVLQKA